MLVSTYADQYMKNVIMWHDDSDGYNGGSDCDHDGDTVRYERSFWSQNKISGAICKNPDLN
jgi:hypothetical protein